MARSTLVNVGKPDKMDVTFVYEYKLIIMCTNCLRVSHKGLDCPFKPIAAFLSALAVFKQNAESTLIPKVAIPPRRINLLTEVCKVYDDIFMLTNSTGLAADNSNTGAPLPRSNVSDSQRQKLEILQSFIQLVGVYNLTLPKQPTGSPFYFVAAISQSSGSSSKDQYPMHIPLTLMTPKWSSMIRLQAPGPYCPPTLTMTSGPIFATPIQAIGHFM
ncbi:uncharacterized protein LOC122088232 [Macadamia integrifolia]|uniref:uncharacterized protein LOC122088232 n=1 Tax=Macadamia integrifolia TaxID=60698 RepID=UPI001C4F3AC3|nr:uncharacterized protein LOC122088232 [Macadamia integrifolia]